MKSNLILTPTEGMSKRDWLYWRWTHGIGASDVACCCGLTASWKSPIELFYQLLDFDETNRYSLRMALGTDMEEVICDWYKYWNGTVDGMLKNRESVTIVNNVSRVKAFIQNEKYPQLFCSLDRRIHKNGDRGEGCLEAKLISGYVAKKYIDDLPPYQLIQVQTQLLITELLYGDLAVMTDAQDYGVYSFEPLQDVFSIANEMTSDMWNRVLQGRIIKTRIHEATISHNGKLKQQLESELVQLEPALIGGDAEEMFLKDKYKKSLDKSIGVKKGTEEQLKVARKLKEVKEEIKILTEQASLHQNTLIREIGEGIALDFDKNGKVKWEGSPKRFYNQVKL